MATTERQRGRPPSSGREEVLRATHELLRERGIARLTTREVAQRAGVSEGSIFYHFTDRPGLLKAVFARSLGPLHLDPGDGAVDSPADSTGDPTGDSPHDGVRETLERVSRGIESFLSNSLDVLMAAQADVELRESLHAYLAENDFGPHRGIGTLSEYVAARQAAGEIRPDVAPRVVAAMVVNDAFQRASLPKLVGHRRGIPSRPDFLDTLVAMLAPTGA